MRAGSFKQVRAAMADPENSLETGPLTGVDPHLFTCDSHRGAIETILAEERSL